MARRAEKAAARFKRLKLKLGGGDGLDVERVRAVRAVTELPLQVDVNEWWSLDEALEALPQLAALGVAYCEQPLKAGDEGGTTLKERSPIPIYVDEDCHRLDSVAACAEIAHGINIKLAKSGGIREAVRMAHAARALGLGVMLGCMIESGLGIAAGCAVAPLCDHVDLDGNLLIADDPWPGSRSSTASRFPRTSRVSVSQQPERLLILAEGFSADPHYGKTARGVLAYGERPVVALLDSTRAGETQNGVPIVASVNDALCFNPTTALVGVATQGGRFPPAWRELLKTAISKGLHVENGLHEFLADDEELAGLAARHGVELRDLRRPPADLNVPTGANLELPVKTVLTVGSDCAIGKMTVSLELDRAARARGLASRFVPTGQTGIAIAGWGISVDAVDLRLHRRRDRAPARRGPRARGRAAAGRGPGRAPASRVLGRDARARARVGAARLRALPPRRADRDRGLPGPSASLAARADRPARADLAPRAEGEGGGDRAQHS